MAIIYSYPSATPTTSDVVIGTLLSDDSGENPTKSFSIADIIGLVPAAGTGGTVTSIGLTNADGFLVIGNSPITTAGDISINLLAAGGTPSATTFYRGDGQWATPPNTTPTTYTISGVTNGPNTDINLTPNVGSGAAASFVKLLPGNDITISAITDNITIASTAVGSITGSTFVNVNSANPLIPIISLSATGTPGATNYLRGDNTWATIAGGGSMSSWNITADTGTPEQVDEAETVTIAGGTGITTAVAATNTVTVTNSGVTSVTATAPIVTSGATGAITLTAPDVLTNTAQVSAQAKITSIISLTAAEYTAIGAGNYNANTLYVVI